MRCHLPRMFWSMVMVGALLGAGVAMTGCASKEGRTALAIEHTSRSADGALTVSTECADIDEVVVTADHGGSPLAEVTVWGRPKLGKCKSRIEVSVEASQSQIVDGATSMVVDLPAWSDQQSQ